MSVDVATGEEVSLVNVVQSVEINTRCYVWFDVSDLNCLEHSSCCNVTSHLRHRFVLDVINAIPDIVLYTEAWGSFVLGNLRSAIMIEDLLE